MRAGRRVGRVILDRERLALALGIVRDDELHRMQHAHRALGLLVEVFAQAVLKEAVFDHARALGNADAVAEVADGRRREAAAAQAAQRRHTRIVPAGDDALLHKLAELALRHDRVIDAKAGKLDLARLIGHGNVVHHPVVERAVRLEFERAQRVRDALKRVLDRVCEVVHREDAPFRALTVVLDIADAVEHGVTHVEVAGGKVNLCAQGVLALRELAGAHAREQIEIFLDRAVAPGADGGGVHIAAVFAELLRRQLAHIGKPFLDELHGVFVILLEVVRAEEKPVAPVKAEPVDVLLNGLNELVVLLGGVRVVHTQVADAAEFLGRAEVDAQCLAVADVQIAVRLRWETGVYGLAGETAAGCEIGFDKGFDKVFGIFHSVMSTPHKFAKILYTIHFLFTISKKKYIIQTDCKITEVRAHV